MLQRKEEELIKRQAIERRALPKRIRAERKARDMMFRESLRISTQLDPDGEREKLKKVNFISRFQPIGEYCIMRMSKCKFQCASTVPGAREETLHPGTATV